MAAQLIVALDLPRKEDALVLARELQGAVPWCKVGMELFTLAGPDIIRELHDLGFHVFLDMKFYDIPHTVAQAVKAAAAAGAELLTLHCQGGERMCSEARIAADSYGSKAPQLFGVTALTSFGPGEMPGILRTLPWSWPARPAAGAWTAWSAPAMRPPASRPPVRACAACAPASVPRVPIPTTSSAS